MVNIVETALLYLSLWPLLSGVKANIVVARGNAESCQGARSRRNNPLLTHTHAHPLRKSPTAKSFLIKFNVLYPLGDGRECESFGHVNILYLFETHFSQHNVNFFFVFFCHFRPMGRGVGRGRTFGIDIKQNGQNENTDTVKKE